MNLPVNMTEQTLIAITKDQTSTVLPGEAVILHPGGGYQPQDEWAARVWELIQSPITVGEIMTVLLREYDVGATSGMRALEQLLAELLDLGLAEVKGEALQNVSRRATGSRER